MFARASLLAGLASLALCGPAHAAGDSDVAALQVALRNRGAFAGAIDGVKGPKTEAAVRGFQRRHGLAVDGVAGPITRSALGRRWSRNLGSRLLRRPARGWDVAELQFRLAWHGFPSGLLDGILGPRTERALVRFQRFAGIAVDGIAGGQTLAALARPLPRVPIRLLRPVDASITSPFGPRGNRFHAGVDLPAATGTPVRAAAGGRVRFTGRIEGFGRLATVSHRGGVRTLYAHLSRIEVRGGQRLAAGEKLGRVGASGVVSSGPHLHFEVHVRGAAADPAPALSG
jgi:murein DD-endopeptidase MepM/ murein hydrolase activator NlpD